MTDQVTGGVCGEAVERAPMRVAFAGTPEFAAVALAALIAAGHDIVLALTQPDRPAGRGMKLQASAVKRLALEHGIPIAQPAGLKLDGKYASEAAAAKATLESARPDVIVVAAYGLILPQWVLDLAPLGCLNIHGSLLPRWRGAAPIHRAIEAGDSRTGITVMQMDAGLDTGPMLLDESVEIGPRDTTGSLHDKLAALGGKLIVQSLDLAAAGRLEPVVQPVEGVTYAHKISKAESIIDWTQPAELIERRIRAFDPAPGASSVLSGQPIKCWGSVVVAVETMAMKAEPGTVVEAAADGIVVACGHGELKLTELQRPGGKRVPAAQFQAAGPVTAGMAFDPRPA
ncbi:methionyl-tRNA formyltransferase [soil metagenome]